MLHPEDTIVAGVNPQAKYLTSAHKDLKSDTTEDCVIQTRKLAMKPAPNNERIRTAVFSNTRMKTDLAGWMRSFCVMITSSDMSCQ